MTANSERIKPMIVATYDYCDEQGELLYQVVRYEPGFEGEPKTFRQRRPDGAGGWIWGLGDARRVPYRLPELLAAHPGLIVFIVEGEKDVETLWALEQPATTNAMGAGKWQTEYSEYLRGRCVIILPDNDEAGCKHAQQVQESLRGVAASVRVVELPGLPPKGDVSDWLAIPGNDKIALLELIQQARREQAEKNDSEAPGAPEAPGVAGTNGRADEDVHLTDTGNARRLVARHGKDLRHCGPWRKWLTWDGRRWDVDQTGRTMRRAKDTVAALFRGAADDVNAIARRMEEVPDA